MITTICPISENVVAIGLSDSCIRLVRIPGHELTSSLAHGALISPMMAHPFLLLGNCGHGAVSDMDVMYRDGTYGLDGGSTGATGMSDPFLIATASSTLSVWDVLKSRRLGSYSSNSQFFACKWLQKTLIAATGSGRALNLFDPRAKFAIKPVWSLDVLSDNLYTIAQPKEQNSCSQVYLAGADGAIYTIDLRAGVLKVWQLPLHVLGGSDSIPSNHTVEKTTNAILDLSLDEDIIVALCENGQVCGIPIQDTKDSFFEDTKGSFLEDTKDSLLKDAKDTGFRNMAMKNQEIKNHGPLMFSKSLMKKATSRIRCDTQLLGDNLHIAVGGDNGTVSILSYNKPKRSIYESKQIKVSSETVLSVLWSPNGLLVGSGDSAALYPTSHLY